jgi:RNA polymerase sigma-70 factor, ECF subfamily
MSAMAPGVPDDVETYRRHAAELIRYATVLVGPDDAPDVVTEAVLAAFASPQWPTVDNRRAYLYRAVLTRSLSHRRSDTRRRRRETMVALRTATRVEPTESALDAHRALASLSGQQRAVIYLTYWEDQSPAQIAELLTVSEGAVRKQLARARDHLRRILDA